MESMITTLYITTVIVVAVGAWMWRGRCEHRRSEQFIADKQNAVTKAKELLAALREGRRSQYEDDWQSREEFFDPKYVSLTEIGTTRQELDRLLALLKARHEARWVANRLRENQDDGMFEYYVNRVKTLLAESDLTAEELKVTDTDIRELRRTQKIRRAGALAVDALSQIRRAHDSIVSMDELLAEASASMSDISWIGDMENTLFGLLREEIAKTPAMT